MSTWPTLLSDIRVDLKDTGTTPRWSDDVIFLYAKDAIRAYSAEFPLVVLRESIAAADGKFALPSTLIGIISVETSEGASLSASYPRPGKTVTSPGSATQYTVAGGYLYLNVAPAAGDTILLSYQRTHNLPTSKTDTTTVMSFPEEDEELIRLFVKAKISEQMRLAQSSLDRFKPGSGSRDDNPLLPEHNELMDEYRSRVAQKLGGIIYLHKGGRFA